ncbi:unnamed protein product [Strongylus vulgaris]|uniref:Uncharacterized protein n=1 Tax=Strongylus vulgaris TaxID=40348 RepID=A0A3P7LAM0_STRVU|nr:unnamed protein product [Strongylus vulgaris]
MPEEEENRIGIFGSGLRNENGNRLAGLLIATRLFHDSIFMKIAHRSQYQLQNSFARRSSKVQAIKTLGSRTRKEKFKEVPQGPSRRSYSADNITKRRGLAHLPDKRWNRSQRDSTPIFLVRQHPCQTPLFPLGKYHQGFYLLKYAPQFRP